MVTGDSFPPEFFFVKLADSTPKQQKPMFANFSFPRENRKAMTQTEDQLYAEFRKNKPLSQTLSDFSLLLYIYLKNLVSKEVMQVVAKSIVTNNPNLLNSVGEHFRKFQVATKPASNTPSKPVVSGQLTPQQKEMLNTLISMGFAEKKALEALRASNFNIESALDFLS